MEPKLMVHAEGYLLQYDIKDEQQCDEKFDNIQTLALDLLRENPNMVPEEFVDQLNHLIQERISFSESQDNGKPKTKMIQNC